MFGLFGKNVTIEYFIISTLLLRSLWKRLSFILIGGCVLIMPLLFMVVSSGGRTRCFVWVSANACFLLLQLADRLVVFWATSLVRLVLKRRLRVLWIHTILAFLKNNRFFFILQQIVYHHFKLCSSIEFGYFIFFVKLPLILFFKNSKINLVFQILDNYD